jgi:hypothetical protein
MATSISQLNFTYSATNIPLARNITVMFAFLNYASRFPDYPANFTVPALTDPDYVVPYRGHVPFYLAIASMILAFGVVLARLLARRFNRTLKFGWDDWVIMFATVSLICEENAFGEY